MISALLYVGASLTILCVLTVVYVLEDARGERLFLKGIRSALDALFEAILLRLRRFSSFFTHGFMRLLLHYGAHSVLKRILATLRNLESKVEEMVRKNRRIAKDIRASKVKNHLDVIAEHKEEVALSEEERQERLSQ